MRSRTGKTLIYALLIAGTVTFLFPLWWMVAVSLMTPEAAQAATVTLLAAVLAAQGRAGAAVGR